MNKFLLLFFVFINIMFADTSDNKNVRNVSLQLLWKHQFQFAGYYMAKEKGFYEDAGLNVTFKELGYGVIPVDEVLNKRATFGIGRSSLLVEKGNGKDIKLLSAIFQSSPLVLMTTPKANITKIEDLRGKSIMISPDRSTIVSINAMLHSKQLSLDYMIRKKHTFNMDDLIKGNVDVTSAYISAQPYKLIERGIEPIIFDPKDYGFDFYNDILFTSNYETQNNPVLVKNFVRASLKGWEYAFNHIDETIEIILDKYNTQHKTKDELLFEANQLKKLAYYNGANLGDINKNKLEKIYNIFNVMGLIKNKIQIDNLIYDINTENSLNLTQSESEYLTNKKVIKMCIDPDWMPFEKFDENGNHIGMTKEYFDILSKIIGIPIKAVRSTSWDQSIEFAKSRKCDIYSLAMSTPERETYMNFTKPYLSVPLVVATRPDVTYINDISVLEHKKIGIVKGYAFNEIIRKKYPNIDVVDVDNVDDGLQKVANRKLFGFVDTLSTIGYKFQTKFIGELKVAGKFSDNWELGIGVRNDDKILFEIFEKALNLITYKQKQDILNKYISIKYEQGIDYSLIWKIIAMFSILFVIFAVFYVKQNLLKKQIEKQKELFETVFKNSKDGIAILDQNSNFLEVNPEYTNMTGMSKDELLKTSCIGMSYPDDRQKSKDIMKEVFIKGYVQNFEKRCVIKDDKVITVNMSMSIIHNPDRVLISVRDITDIRKKDKVIAEQAKMAALGEMLGNIAHQWRQPLSVITTGVTGMQMQKQYGMLTDDVFNKTCDGIEENAQYLSKTIDDFRNFIKGDSKKDIFELKDVIKKSLTLIEAQIKTNHIELIVDLQDGIKINNYESALLQSMVNILNNSVYAINENNKTDKLLFIETVKDKNSVTISIKDNGGGIDKDVLPKIFEPYFTTKHKSKGTGLGLNMTYSLITDNMNGTISAENTKFRYKDKDYVGAKFNIVLQID